RTRGVLFYGGRPCASGRRLKSVDPILFVKDRIPAGYELVVARLRWSTGGRACISCNTCCIWQCGF
ncbi:hypothetical protein QSH52_020875, partial [Xanthomonas arboricola pv. juglandis]|uniref:hypothetical protein n=1 Tax=Xanthomonas arboricola TaxID=56448 RepID=UPI0035E770F9